MVAAQAAQALLSSIIASAGCDNHACHKDRYDQDGEHTLEICGVEIIVNDQSGCHPHAVYPFYGDPPERVGCSSTPCHTVYPSRDNTFPGLISENAADCTIRSDGVEIIANDSVGTLPHVVYPSFGNRPNGCNSSPLHTVYPAFDEKPPGLIGENVIPVFDDKSSGVIGENLFYVFSDKPPGLIGENIHSAFTNTSPGLIGESVFPVFGDKPPGLIGDGVSRSAIVADVGDIVASGNAGAHARAVYPTLDAGPIAVYPVCPTFEDKDAGLIDKRARDVTDNIGGADTTANSDVDTPIHVLQSTLDKLATLIVQELTTADEEIIYEAAEILRSFIAAYSGPTRVPEPRSGEALSERQSTCSRKPLVPPAVAEISAGGKHFAMLVAAFLCALKTASTPDKLNLAHLRGQANDSSRRPWDIGAHLIEAAA